jgi:hypothetical protein
MGTDDYKKGYVRGRSGKDSAESVVDVARDSFDVFGVYEKERKDQEEGFKEGLRDRLNEEHKKNQRAAQAQPPASGAYTIPAPPRFSGTHTPARSGFRATMWLLVGVVVGIILLSFARDFFNERPRSAQQSPLTQASPPVPATPEQNLIAEQQVLRSDLDLNRYCTSRGFNGVVNVDGTGYGWQCVPGNVGIDVNQLCKEQFGNAFKAILISTPPGGKNDWRCQATPYTGVTPAPPCDEYFSHSKGQICKTGSEWKETNPEGIELNFREVKRDNEWIFLFDSSRNIYLRIPTVGKGCCSFSNGNMNQWVDLYYGNTSKR